MYTKNYFYDKWNTDEKNEIVEFILPIENIEIFQILNLNIDNLFNVDIESIFVEYKGKKFSFSYY